MTPDQAVRAVQVAFQAFEVSLSDNRREYRDALVSMGYTGQKIEAAVLEMALAQAEAINAQIPALRRWLKCSSHCADVRHVVNAIETAEALGARRPDQSLGPT